MAQIVWRSLLTLVLASAAPGAATRSAAAGELIQGSPILTVLPQDAIPAIDAPTFVSATEADPFLRPDELVLSLPDGGTARAYSAWQLNHHEIVNDTVEGRPVVVTW
ncbi:MAG: DUF3179 domain-containing protein [candidate division NC10 bacterium]|nr:DUF3179 domain-containing protein [candidate division NC10 bacterium]